MIYKINRLHEVIIIINNFQNVLFYALSDDIKTAREKLLLKENIRFDIVFPGDGDISSPGKVLISNIKYVVRILYLSKVLFRIHIFKILQR